MEKWTSAFNIINRRGEGQSFENTEEFEAAMKEAHLKRNGIDRIVYQPKLPF